MLRQNDLRGSLFTGHLQHVNAPCLRGIRGIAHFDYMTMRPLYQNQLGALDSIEVIVQD